MGFFNDLREDLASAVNQLTDDKSENDIEISSKQMKDEIAKKEKKNKKDKHNNENLEREIKNYLNVSEEATEAVSEENSEEQTELTFENLSEETESANEVTDTVEIRSEERRVGKEC